MKKITNLLIVCSLALAGAVTAQEPTPEETKSPGKKADKKAPAEVKPKTAPAPKTEAPAVAPKTDAPAEKDRPVKEAPEPGLTKKEKKAPDAPKSAPAATSETKPSADQPATASTPAADKKQQKTEKPSSETKKSPAATADTTPGAVPKSTAPAPGLTKATPTPATAAATSTPAAKATATAAATTTTATATPATTTTTTTASATPAAATTAATATPATATTTTATATPATATTGVSPAAVVKKPDPQKVEQIRQRTVNFTAQPRPDRVPAVTFTPNYRIQGAEQWQGPQYEVYRTYRPERHDQGYYRSRYQRVELIAGGYYYFDRGYWYPAWGYDPRNEYYAYDAPIYAGKRALPPDKVIAEVQAVLQEMGYYKGEVDGLIGPLTRAALTGYQRDNGMTVTAVIDEPTLESLGMS